MKPAGLTITESDYQILSNILSKYIPNIKVWFYGSRITGKCNPYSDLDMIIFLPESDREKYYILRESLEESDITIKIDLFTWDSIPVEFKENIKKNHLELKGVN